MAFFLASGSLKCILGIALRVCHFRCREANGNGALALHRLRSLDRFLGNAFVDFIAIRSAGGCYGMQQISSFRVRTADGAIIVSACGRGRFIRCKRRENGCLRQQQHNGKKQRRHF